MKTVLITGGSSGLGRALAVKLADQGIKVFIVGRDEEKLVQVSQLSTSFIVPIKADISKEDERQKLIRTIRADKLDYIVHNAATEKPLKVFGEITLEEWQYAFSLNVEAVFSLTQGALNLLQPGSRLLMISSGLAYKPLGGLSAYCCSKAALNMLTECLKVELKPREISVALGLPGVIDTEMQHRLKEEEKVSGATGSFFRDLSSKSGSRSPVVVASFFERVLLNTEQFIYTGTVWDINHVDELSKKFS